MLDKSNWEKKVKNCHSFAGKEEQCYQWDDWWLCWEAATGQDRRRTRKNHDGLCNEHESFEWCPWEAEAVAAVGHQRETAGQTSQSKERPTQQTHYWGSRYCLVWQTYTLFWNYIWRLFRCLLHTNINLCLENWKS